MDFLKNDFNLGKNEDIICNGGLMFTQTFPATNYNPVFPLF
jgi:hypothetical protein